MEMVSCCCAISATLATRQTPTSQNIWNCAQICWGRLDTYHWRMQNANNSGLGKVTFWQQCDEAKAQVYAEFLGRLV